MIYAKLTVRLFDGTLEEIDLQEKDTLVREEGGFELTFASSPATTTFLPDHRIWEYKEVDTDKLRKLVEVDDTADDSML